MPCTAGGAPVAIELVQTRVTLGNTERLHEGCTLLAKAMQVRHGVGAHQIGPQAVEHHDDYALDGARRRRGIRVVHDEAHRASGS
jgi:hypothetical protein